MFRAIVLALSLASASAFVAPAPARASVKVHETKADLEKLAFELNPALGFYDPLNLAEASFWGQSNEATIGWLRHSEIKHSRVAMAAFVGYCLSANNVRFPWPGVGGEVPTTTSPPELWDQMSVGAAVQIIWFVGFLEWFSESQFGRDGEPHYMRGGKPGAFPSFKGGKDFPHPVPLDLFDPFGFSKNKTPEQKAKGLRAEINNGRAAMLGLFGFLSESKIPGSVPMLTVVIPSYGGDYMGPLPTDFWAL